MSTTEDSHSMLSQDKAFPQFGDSPIEVEHEIIYIYDSLRTRRWAVHGFTMNGENHMRLELQGEVGNNWHSLMSGYGREISELYPEYVKSSIVNAQADGDDTGKGYAIGVDVLSGPSEEEGIIPGRHIVYTSIGNGVLVRGWGEVYRGRREDITHVMQNLHATAVEQEDLPKRINVDATLGNLAKAFREGSFNTPSFVLPENPIQRLFVSLRRTLIKSNPDEQRSIE